MHGARWAYPMDRRSGWRTAVEKGKKRERVCMDARERCVLLAFVPPLDIGVQNCVGIVAHAGMENAF